MSTYYETGHAKNVANLLKLNQLIATFGTTYNPSNNAIKATGLATLYTNANARELAFDPLAKLSISRPLSQRRRSHRRMAD